MQWYAGDIVKAVTLAQTKKAVFFVAILGTDESSQELETSLNTSELQTIVATENFVCIRLEADSEQHKQFSEIYANAKSPSIYCITDKGVPVEIITTALPSNELKERLESALVRHRQVLGAKLPTVVSPTASAVETKNVSKPDSSSASSSSAPSNDPPSTTSTEEPPLEERIQRARELAAARQLKKQQDEDEEKRRREIERRKELKGAAELKRWQQEQEAKKEMDERKKDREDEKLLRQRLREQIAQDRAARNARTNVEVMEQTKNTTTATATTTAVQRPTVTSTSPANFSGQARLQFRLPDGSSQTHAFEPNSTLGHVRQYLIDQGSVPFRDFTLWVAFPRRQFTETDYGTSLRELGLLPSAALLILPANGLSMNPSNGGLWALIATLLGFVVYPITLVWSVFQRALPAPSAGNSSTTNNSQNNSGDAADKRLNSAGGKVLGSRGDQPSTSTSGTNPSTNSATNINDNPNLAVNKKKSKDKNNPSATQKESGNVHRLRTKEDDSEDEAFYNGNSTQQM